MRANGGQVKGLLLTHLRDYLREKQGSAPWPALEARLKEQDPGVWGGLILAAGWYPITAWNRALSTWLEMRSDAQEEVRRIGHFVAERDLSTVYRALLRVAPPEFVISRTPSLWARYFDQGKIEIGQRDGKRWELHIVAPADQQAAPGKETCPGIAAWLESALVLTGNEARVLEARCRYMGAPSCLLDVSL